MTIATKTTVKTYFETGDFPTQSNFTDLIDSFLGLGETASQTIGGPITVSGAGIFRTGVTVSGNTGLYGDITFGASAASTARTSMGLGTAAVLNTGVSANNVPKLDSSNRLPAVDGSLLTNLPTAGVLLSTQTASASATIDFTSGIDSTYKHYILEVSNWTATTGAPVPQILFRQGGSFVTGANYNYGITATNSSGTGSNSGAVAATAINLSNNQIDTGVPSSFILHLFQPNLATQNSLFWHGVNNTSSTNAIIINGAGSYTSSVATTGIRFQQASSTIATGTFKLYGVS